VEKGKGKIAREIEMRFLFDVELSLSLSLVLPKADPGGVPREREREGGRGGEGEGEGEGEERTVERTLRRPALPRNSGFGMNPRKSEDGKGSAMAGDRDRGITAIDRAV